MNSRNELKGLFQEFSAQIFILGGLIAIMWGIEVFDQLTGGFLDQFGILPRTVIGLRGILFAPFLHGGFGHLMSNTIPFLVLGWLVMLRRTSDFFVVSVIVMLVSGFGTWALGATAFHIGASGVIFGYLGYLVLRGYFERSFGSIVFSLFVGVIYGGLIWGVLPTQSGISWEGHLFGFLGGIVAARVLAERKPKRLDSY